MKYKEMIEQLESLKENSQSFISNSGEDEIWKLDIEALDKAINLLEKTRWIPCRDFLEKKQQMEKQKSVTDLIEEIKAEICDKYCKYSAREIDDEDIEKICTECPLNKL